MFKVSDAFESWIARNCNQFYADVIGINSYAELVQWRDQYGIDAPMPVYRPTCAEVDLSIFKTQAGYMGFQAWHDRRHLTYSKAFTLEDETFLAAQHYEELLRDGVDRQDATAIYHLIYGRNAFYHNNGQMIAENAAAFVQQAFDCGVEYAARDQRATA